MLQTLRPLPRLSASWLTCSTLIVLAGLTSCDKLTSRGAEVDTALFEVEEVEEVEVADLEPELLADTEDVLEEADLAEVDAGPPLDCNAECAAVAEPIDECFGAFLSAGPVTASRAVAYRFATLEEALEARTALLALVPEVTLSRTQRVVLLEGAPAAQLRTAADGVGGEELRVLSAALGGSVVVVPSVVFRLADDVTSTTRKRLLTGLKDVRPGPMPSTLLADLGTGDAMEWSAALRREKQVVYADPVLLRRYELRTEPLLAHQWHLDASAHAVALPSADINAPQAWSITSGDPSVLIGIYDDGVDWLHPDLAADVILPALLSPPDLGAAIAAGCCTHGTAVAGVAAATGDNGIGVSGVCPGCKILPLFADFSLLSEFEVAQNLRLLVDHGAAVINCSWGPMDGSPVVVDEPVELGPVSGVLKDAFDYAETQGRGGLGTVITWAAGNGNESVGSDGYASYATTVAVAAYNDQDRKSWYSDYGDAIDVAAPSSGGLSAGIVTTVPSAGSSYGTVFTGAAGERYTKAFGGTSSAAPTTAGLAGLVISANPLLTAAQVRQILRDTARKIDRLNAGYDANGHSLFYGYGAIDAYAAVLAAQAVTCGVALADRVEECNGADDNCNGQVDEGCAVLGECQPCTYDAACASGICARTSGDTEEHCLAACDEQGACGAGFVCAADLCVPQSGRCAACAPEETCDGVDDDCDGEIDEGEVCTPNDLGSCFYDAQCKAGGRCASNFCRSVCETDADCGGDHCREATMRYGETDGTRFCDTGAGAFCKQFVCDSGEKDRTKRRFFECVVNANGDCNDILVCALPFF